MKKILIVEGNLREENQHFSSAGIQTHTESLKDSLSFFTKDLTTDVVNPSSDENIFKNSYVIFGVYMYVCASRM